MAKVFYECQSGKILLNPVTLIEAHDAKIMPNDWKCSLCKIPLPL